MASPIWDIKTKLAMDGIVPASLIYLGHLPPSPHTLVCVMETAPWSPIRTMQTLPKCHRFGVQVFVRWEAVAGSYEFARMRAVAILEALQGFSGNINGSDYLDIAVVGDVSPVGQDETKRDQLSLNFVVYRTQG